MKYTVLIADDEPDIIDMLSLYMDKNSFTILEADNGRSALEILREKNVDIALVSSDEKVIVDTQSALDLAMTVKYETGTNKIIMEKQNIADEFFVLSSGMAGEILQKFINYHIKIAIYGDYSKYTSKPLKDFIYESNKGKDVFFVSTLDEAVDMLTR